MNNDSEPAFLRSIQGQLLRQSERREVAIFLWHGALWVADFIDGDGKLIEAATWFRFNCGAVASAHSRRRMVLESATPLSTDLVARIWRLHDGAMTHRRGSIGRLLEIAKTLRARNRWSAAAARVFARQRTNRGVQGK
jgi:hypothetical protein